MSEASLQSAIVKYLKEKGCYVIKTRAGVGTPDGCPDIIALCGGLWFAIEVKASSTAKYQPLQKDTLEKLDSWSWAKVVYPENWRAVKAELEMMI
jgi:Holliday junction resolvase